MSGNLRAAVVLLRPGATRTRLFLCAAGPKRYAVRMKRIRAGLVGYGVSGSIFHAPLMSTVKRLHLAAVMTSRMDKVRRELPNVWPVYTIDNLLSDSSLALVVI